MKLHRSLVSLVHLMAGACLLGVRSLDGGQKRELKVYLDSRDWWVGYYRGTDHHYVCLLPTVVLRWSRSPVPPTPLSHSDEADQGDIVVNGSGGAPGFPVGSIQYWGAQYQRGSGSGG